MNSAIISLFILVQSMPLRCLEPTSEVREFLNQIEKKANLSDSLKEKEEEKISKSINELNDKDIHIRVKALFALYEFGDKAMPALINALKHEDYKLRRSAADVLGFMGERAAGAVSALADALNDSATIVRVYAALALGEIGPKAKSAMPALEAAVKDKAYLVRDASAEALRKIKKPAADNKPVKFRLMSRVT
jgi:HEAT repeat protein